MGSGQLGVALIGYRFMGKAHSHAYRNVGMFFPDLPKVGMNVIAGRDPEALAEAAAQFGWADHTTDWRDAISRDDVDIVDVSVPGDAHPEIAIAAAEAGKHVFCEKPLANTLDEARTMLQAVEKAGVTTSAPSSCRTGSWTPSSRWCGGCAGRWPGPGRWVTWAPT
jgi:predicted dehydrogenase